MALHRTFKVVATRFLKPLSSPSKLPLFCRLWAKSFLRITAIICCRPQPSFLINSQCFRLSFIKVFYFSSQFGCVEFVLLSVLSLLVTVSVTLFFVSFLKNAQVGRMLKFIVTWRLRPGIKSPTSAEILHIAHRRHMCVFTQHMHRLLLFFYLSVLSGTASNCSIPHSSLSQKSLPVWSVWKVWEV